MNVKLIFGLSLFGLGMAFATVYFIPSKVEPFCWLPVFIVCAYFIAKNAPGKYFLHGFLVSMVNCVWITAAHIYLSTPYLANHPTEAQQYAKTFKETGLTVTQAMLIMAPFIGILSGLVLGLFSNMASKVVKH